MSGIAITPEMVDAALDEWFGRLFCWRETRKADDFRLQMCNALCAAMDASDQKKRPPGEREPS